MHIIELNADEKEMVGGGNQGGSLVFAVVLGYMAACGVCYVKTKNHNRGLLNPPPIRFGNILRRSAFLGGAFFASYFVYGLAVHLGKATWEYFSATDKKNEELIA